MKDQTSLASISYFEPAVEVTADQDDCIVVSVVAYYTVAAVPGIAAVDLGTAVAGRGIVAAN